jgi:hypothetical protein
MSRLKTVHFILLIWILPLTGYAQREHVYQVIISECKYGGNRIQTGFRVRTRPGIVTALHGVAGCGDIRLVGETGAQKLLGSFKIVALDFSHDVALLESDQSRGLPPEGLDIAPSVDWRDIKKVQKIGYPINVPTNKKDDLILREPQLIVLRDGVPSDMLGKLLTRGSPDPDETVVDIAGILLPGDSGAPILDSSNRVIAVGNGGLMGGVAQINWAIPWLKIDFKDVIAVTRFTSLEQSNPGSLFSFESSADSDGNRERRELERLAIAYSEPSFLERVVKGDAKVVDLFLRSGIQPDAKDGNEKTALLLAAENNHLDVVKILLAKGAQANARGRNGMTSLMVAARKGYPETVKLLIDAKAEVNAKDNLNGRPVLQYAVWGDALALNERHIETARLLVKAGADINAKDEVNNTALLTAVYVAGLGKTEENLGVGMVRLLIESGADLNARNDLGNGVLDMKPPAAVRKILESALTK